MARAQISEPAAKASMQARTRLRIGAYSPMAAPRMDEIVVARPIRDTSRTVTSWLIWWDCSTDPGQGPWSIPRLHRTVVPPVLACHASSRPYAYAFAAALPGRGLWASWLAIDSPWGEIRRIAVPPVGSDARC